MTSCRQVERPVLIIDDEPLALKLLSHQIRRAGFSCLHAHGDSLAGLGAAQRLRGQDALLFLDLQMPDLDGIEFIRELATHGFDGELVLVSGEHRRIVQVVIRLARAHGLRVLGALEKPARIEDLTRLLEQPAAPASRQHQTSTTPAWMSRIELQLALNSGHLRNVYQPQVDLRDGRMTGVETLVRWQHPVHGQIPPDQFIHFAECEDMIHQVTHHVLSEAFCQMQRWDAGGLPLQVAVNISMDDLDDLNFPDWVAETARLRGGTLTRLALEVTESRLMRDPLRAVDALGRLRLKRVSLSIDDYGTGHSSLSQLRDLPFDELKLDQTFVRGAHLRSDLRCILESTIRMAQTLDLHTVAEGVETEAEWQLLRKLGCEAAQGWFICRPLAGDEIPAWQARWSNQLAPLLASAAPFNASGLTGQPVDS
jgi:EAL domain-containing protein (putative c-di-GMP-specific phosphodiesterase class I)/FixJ family two-component response regulator